MSNVLSALQHIDVAAVSYQEWVNVGMALKAEGFDWTVWDDWSRNDPRYHPGECQRKWATFRGSATPITGGSIVQMAKDYGWTPCSEGAALDWNDTIMDDGDSFNFGDRFFEILRLRKRPLSKELVKRLVAPSQLQMARKASLCTGT